MNTKEGFNQAVKEFKEMTKTEEDKRAFEEYALGLIRKVTTDENYCDRDIEIAMNELASAMIIGCAARGVNVRVMIQKFVCNLIDNASINF